MRAHEDATGATLGQAIGSIVEKEACVTVTLSRSKMTRDLVEDMTSSQNQGEVTGRSV